jgi:hypothetical protein
MSSPIRSKLTLFVVLILVAYLFQNLLSYTAAYAEPETLVHICVAPVQGRGFRPYLLTFRNTQLFGLIVPHTSANVVVYGDQGLWAKLYTIKPNTPSGGYRVLQNLAESEAQPGATDPSRPRPCADMDAYRDLLPKTLPSTIPLLVSSDRAVYVQTDGKDKLAADALGVFSFVFEANDRLRFPPSFQVVQLDGINFDIRLPFVPAGSQFTLLANKYFSMRQSRPAKDNVFGSSKAPDPFGFLIEGYTTQDEQKQFFQALDRANTHIYLTHGFASTGSNLSLSYLGGFIKVEHDSQTPRREDLVITDSEIRAVTGAIPHYVLTDDPGRMYILSGTVSVVRLDEESGELIIRTSDDREGKILEPWLVQPTGKIIPRSTATP